VSLNSPVVRRIAAHTGAIAASLLCLWIVWDLWKADLRFPLISLTGDAIFAQGVFFKGMVDNPWFLDNKWLGAPFGLNMRDFPIPELLVLSVAKLLAFFTKNHNLIRNLIAIASYPLITATSLHVMRRLGIRYTIALCGSLLFAFLTFHNARISAHIMYGIGYFTVPFATLLSLELFGDEPVFIEARGGAWFKWIGSRSTWTAAAWCVVMGLTGSAYYPLFSCYVLMIAGVFAAFHHRSLWPWLRSLCMQGFVGLGLFVALLPTIVHEQVHGHSATIVRDPRAAEEYGLKIVQLIIPGAGHRLDALRHLGDFYNHVAPLVTENRTAYLGIIGIAGFLYLTFALLRGKEHDSRLHTLGVLNIAVLLLGTIGGFSSLISFLVSDKIRSYNRISVYVAFFALLALALLAERAATSWANTLRKRTVSGIVLFGLLCVGLWDQCAIEIDYGALKQEFLAEDEFVARIESQLPPNSAIFQYPYFPFPEHGPVAQLAEYAPMIPYLHSKSLRWSYGAIKGRRGDAWIASVAAMPANEAVEKLALAGFSGIFVNRQGYGDHGANLEASLTPLLGKPSVVSPNGDRSFYSLVPRVAALRSKLGPDEFQQRQLDALSPVYLAWRDGFYPPERTGQTERAWCKSKGRFVIENPSSRAKHIVLDADLRVAQTPATIHLRSDLFSRDIQVAHDSYHLSDGFDVPPGEHFVTVETDSHASKQDNTRRDLRIAFTGARMEVASH
jgi:phosphoglycerol transferase